MPAVAVYVVAVPTRRTSPPRSMRRRRREATTAEPRPSGDAAVPSGERHRLPDLVARELGTFVRAQPRRSLRDSGAAQRSDPPGRRRTGRGGTVDGVGRADGGSGRPLSDRHRDRIDGTWSAADSPTIDQNSLLLTSGRKNELDMTGRVITNRVVDSSRVSPHRGRTSPQTAISRIDTNSMSPTTPRSPCDVQPGVVGADVGAQLVEALAPGGQQQVRRDEGLHLPEAVAEQRSLLDQRDRRVPQVDAPGATVGEPRWRFAGLATNPTRNAMPASSDRRDRRPAPAGRRRARAGSPWSRRWRSRRRSAPSGSRHRPRRRAPATRTTE